MSPRVIYGTIMDYFTELKRRKNRLDELGMEYLEQIKDEEGIILMEGSILGSEVRSAIKDKLKDLMIDSETDGVDTDGFDRLMEDPSEQKTMRYHMGHSQPAEDALIVNAVRFLRGDCPRLQLERVATIKLKRKPAKSKFFSYHTSIEPAPMFYAKLTFDE